MPICPDCDEPNPADSPFCRHCGARLPSEPKETDQPEQPPQPQADDHSGNEVLALLQEGKKIQAIKVYREKTGAGLKDAKEAVEKLAAEHGIQGQGTGCAGVVLLAVVLGGTLVASLC